MASIPHYPTVQKDGVVTHVLVPVEEFERLRLVRDEEPEAAAPSDAEIAEAVRVLEDPGTRWHDAEAVLWEIVRGGLAAVRKERGLTQEELAARLGVAQPQISRMERSLEGTTVRVLRRLAAALAEEAGGTEPEGR